LERAAAARQEEREEALLGEHREESEAQRRQALAQAHAAADAARAAAAEEHALFVQALRAEQEEACRELQATLGKHHKAALAAAKNEWARQVATFHLPTSTAAPSHS